MRLLALLASGVLAGPVASAATTPRQPQSIGLLTVSIRTAGVETPHMDECPEGVAVGNDEIWWKALNPRDRDRLTDGGAKGADARRLIAEKRGPKGEDVCWNPTVVRDPPMRVLRGARSEGLNLDGTLDGRATEKTCAHQKFTSPSGEAGIDNQMRRLVGCIYGWRKNGYIEITSDTEKRDSSQGVLMIKIDGVTSLEDSPDVTVRFFRSADSLPKDFGGSILPFKSYRIDGNPRYGATAHGRIKNGVLTTNPIDVVMPFYGNRVETEWFIRDLRLNLKLGANDASGTIAGYHDLNNWWDYVRKMGYLIETAQFSCPALYQAALTLADGNRDPKTGNCTSLSVAYDIKAVRAFVVESPPPILLPQADEGAAVDLSTLPFGITQQATGVGTVLADTAGRTLYVPTAKSCTGKCLAHFTALPAPWIAQSGAQWTTTLMQDLGRQWLFAGKPVYTCADDNRPGDAHCLRDGWTTLIVKARNALPDFITVQRSELGPIIADRQGRTLYKLIGDLTTFKKEICDEACFKEKWHPVKIEAALPHEGLIGTMQLDGQTVASFQGKPLYLFADDPGPNAIAGHRFGGASVSAKNWFSAVRVDEATEPPVKSAKN